MSSPGPPADDGRLDADDIIDLAGVGLEAIVHWRQIGWLPDPDADPDGRHRYRAEDVVRVLCRLDHRMI